MARCARSSATLSAALFLFFAESLPLSAAPRGTEVRIFAAASLTDALSEVTVLFETSHPGTRVVPQFGGSSDLARQILAGAPADLFFSADENQMDRVAAAGLVGERLAPGPSLQSAGRRRCRERRDSRFVLRRIFDS